jgi:hypothetical protein
MELLRTYTIKSRSDGYIWQFKYHLNGILAEFKMLDGVLSETQINWLKANYPFYEADVKQWQEKLKSNFEINIGEPDLSFSALWELYAHKVKRIESEKRYNKLKEADKLKIFFTVPGYKYYLQVSGVAQANLATFIHQQYYEDDWYAVAKELIKRPTGKNQNPTLAELAMLKTNK